MMLSSMRLRENIVNKGPEVKIERTAIGHAYPPLLNCITNVGFDVTLGVETGRAYDLTSQRHLEYQHAPGRERYLLIEPGHTVSVQTSETITLGPRTAALVESKVRLVSRGVSHISTTIDPSWSGPLMLTFTYFGKRRLRIGEGDRIATIVFFETDLDEHASGDASPKNNSDRWTEYDKEESEARKARRITTMLFAVAFLIGFVFWFAPLAATVLSEVFNEKSEIGKLAKDVLGDTARQKIELLSWLVVLVSAASAVFNYVGRRLFFIVRRRLGGTAGVPRDNSAGL